MTQADGLAGEAFNNANQQPPTHPELLGQAASAGYVDQLAERPTPDLGEGGEAAYPQDERLDVAGPAMEEMIPDRHSDLSLVKPPITLDKPEDKPAQPSITSHIREAAARAIESFLADVPVNNRHEVTIGRLARLAFDGQKVPRKQFKMFESAVKNDSRLEYRPGKRRFAATGFDDTAPAESDSETSSPPPRRRKVKVQPESRKRLDQLLVDLRRDPEIKEVVDDTKSQHHRQWRHRTSKAKSYKKRTNNSAAKKRR